jgi:transcriptional regulator with XRE-family HTH domain
MGEKLKSLRIAKKLTQKQVADRIGLAISAVSSYESGTRYPSYDVLIKLATMFHVSTDYLIGMTDVRNIDITGLSDEEVSVIAQMVDILRNKKQYNN